MGMNKAVLFNKKVRRLKMSKRERVLSYVLAVLVLLSAVMEFTVLA